jgi:nitrogen regulatory protein P-II 1
MKKIEAVIKPFQVDAVKEALSEGGVDILTMSEVRGSSRQKGRAVYRGAEYLIDVVPKTKLEIVVANEAVSRVVRAIRSAAGQGVETILILSVEEAHGVFAMMATAG